MRRTLSIIAGYALWTVIWLAGNALILQPMYPDDLKAFQDGGALSNTTYLGFALLLSMIASAAAGFACGRLAQESTRRPVMIMATFLLVTGLLVQGGVWEQMPIWYHLSFLLLLVPTCLVAGTTQLRGETVSA